MKKCKVCQQDKSFSAFDKIKTCRDGYANTCKECFQKRRRANMSDEQKKRNAQAKKEWCLRNPEKVKQYAKGRYQKQKQKLLEKGGEDLLRQYWKERAQKYRDKNPEKMRAYIREYQRKWLAKNPHYYTLPHKLSPGIEKNFYIQSIKKNLKFYKELLDGN